MTRRPRDEAWNTRVAGLYDRLGVSLYRYALMILADPTGAADVVQQVFVGLIQRHNAAIASEERYLRRAVRNECYSTLRRRRNESFGGDEPALLETAAAGGAEPELRLALERAIRGLPPEQREVLHMKVYEGFTFQEIADQMDESINTVASQEKSAVRTSAAAAGSHSTTLASPKRRATFRSAANVIRSRRSGGGPIGRYRPSRSSSSSITARAASRSRTDSGWRPC